MRDFGISLVFPMDLMALLIGWRITAFSALGRRLWRLVPTAVCWVIRSERNNRAFYGRSEPTWKVLMRVKDFIVFWAKRCNDLNGIPNENLVRNWDSYIGRYDA